MNDLDFLVIATLLISMSVMFMMMLLEESHIDKMNKIKGLKNGRD